MRLLLTHFYNEEYLLPWWLQHHREQFDHGVLINYASTDNSVDICRELVPDWEIVDSEHETFSGIMCDFEVMKHEERFPGAWKLVLNTTEFLVGTQLDNVLRFLETNDYLGGRIPGAVMVDTQPQSPPDPALPLVDQKHHGFWESDFPFAELELDWLKRPTRTRVLHRYAIGAYGPGRHSSALPGLVNVRRDFLGIYWYGFSPWTPEFVSRKAQIKDRVDDFDKRVGFGHQHMVEEADMAARHSVLREHARTLASSNAGSPGRQQ